MCVDDAARARPLALREFEGQKLLACPACNFVHWDNPSPVVACLIPLLLEPLPRRYQLFPSLFDAEPSRYGIVLVQRGVPPFVGEWCLPCGHINRKENPKVAGRRETEEESGLIVRLVSLVNACTPQVPGVDLNELIVMYLAHALGGELRKGSDALDARIFPRHKLPKICFGSHQLIVDDWFAGNLGTLRHPKQTIDRKQTPINFALTAQDFTQATS